MSGSEHIFGWDFCQHYSHEAADASRHL